MIRRFALTVVLGLLLLSAGQAWAEKLVLFQNQSPISGVTIVAKAKGFFEQNGLDVEVRNVTSGKLALDALIGGSANLATVAETPIMRAGLSGQPLALLATMEASDNDVQFLVRTERIKSVPDFKGKRIATAVGTSAEYMVVSALAAHGLKTADLTIINLRPQDMAAALERGDIDAYAIWEPHINSGRKLLGGKAAVLEARGIYTETFNIVGMRAYAERNPALVQRFLKSLLAAEDFIKQNPEEAIRVVAEGVQLDANTMTEIWRNFDFRVELKASILELMEKQAKWDLASGKTIEVGDVPKALRELLSPDALKTVAPDRISGL